MKKLTATIGLVLVTLSLMSCSKSFRDVAKKNGFNSGYAITPGDILEPVSTEIIKNDCNILVYENGMKWSYVHPSVRFWNWNDIDKLVEFSQKNKIRVKWHTLLWHQQNPGYLSSSWSREEAIKVMYEQIETIMTRYKGKVSEYDVVNEMFEEDGSYRNTIWLKTIGKDYIELALKKAHEVDPNAKLYLNEYNNEEKGHPKAEAMYNMVKDFKSRGVPVDGVGMQLHLDATLNYSETAIRDNLQRLSDLGLEISFSELDVRIPTSNVSEYEKVQEDVYLMIYKLACEMDCVKSVILWGFTDRHSWVPGTFAGKGSALFYDVNYKPKNVYKTVFEMLK